MSTKEEIIKKFKAEAQDEGKDFTNQIADDFSFMLTAILTTGIFTYNALVGIDSYQLLGVIFFFLGIGVLKRFSLIGGKVNLAFGIFNLILAISFIGLHVYKTFPW